jgi:nitroreductase
MTSNTPRASTHPIDPLFLERWSPRAFDSSKLSDTELFTILEAARWAPSSFNHQPWRFVYAHRESTDWDRFVGLLMPFNAMWARHASVLLFIVSDTMIRPFLAAKNVLRFRFVELSLGGNAREL